VDRSATKTDGDLYITWEDGRFLLYPDLESPFGRYGYANILISRSCDGGKTWSPPVRVNDDPVALTNGRGTDHFQPAVGVDKTSKVAACWYDRRADSFNYKIARFCGISTNKGSTWTSTHVGLPSWPPIHATDAIVNPFYLGDYDTVVSDYTKTSSGFVGAFGNVTTKGVFVPNQDVLAVHVQ
jgi:hypothetical protein